MRLPQGLGAHRPWKRATPASTSRSPPPRRAAQSIPPRSYPTLDCMANHRAEPGKNSRKRDGLSWNFWLPCTVFMTMQAGPYRTGRQYKRVLVMNDLAHARKAGLVLAATLMSSVALSSGSFAAVPRSQCATSRPIWTVQSTCPSGRPRLVD
jgi:hypothetical protein